MARAANARAISAISVAIRSSTYPFPQPPVTELHGHAVAVRLGTGWRADCVSGGYPSFLRPPSSYHDAGAVRRPSCLWTSVAPGVDARRLRPDTKMPVPTTNARNVIGCGRRLWRRWRVAEGRAATAVRSGFLWSTTQTN